MHEISLVQGLFTQLHSLAQEHRKSRVLTVTMEIGPLSGVVIDSFQFGFDVLSADDKLIRGAQLLVICPPATYRCCGCNATTEAEVRPEACPRCGETLLSPEGGDDLILQQVEME